MAVIASRAACSGSCTQVGRLGELRFPKASGHGHRQRDDDGGGGALSLKYLYYKNVKGIGLKQLRSTFVVTMDV